MYNKRVRIFIIVSACLLFVCVLSLVQMQLLSGSFYKSKIAELKLQRGLSQQLKTVRGKIFDRKGRVLATDEAKLYLHINYGLSCFADERFRRAELVRAAGKHNPDTVSAEVQRQLQTGLEDLQNVIEKCVRFGVEHGDIVNRIDEINDSIWSLCSFLAWVRNDPNPDILEKYGNEINSIPFSEAIADFEKEFPDEQRRLELVSRVSDIAEMEKNWPLLELKTDDDVFAAQLEFMDTDGVRILPRAHRVYPYGSAAAQTIGWVGLPQEADKEVFAGDRLLSYLEDEVCGREDGVEYVCEAILRGRRGRVVYDIDHMLVEQTPIQLGRDVSLTLDIELQEKIEDYLADCRVNPNNCNAPMAAVVIDVVTGDILALVSTPGFDLNRARYDYSVFGSDPNEPLRNRAINKQYPPGSVVKPLVLIAGLETGKITPDEIIGCPAQDAPKGWPNCWIYNRYNWMGHNDQWRNNARNAIKGSCNIYFSRLANRIEPAVLQQWLLDFGYGKEILLSPAEVSNTRHGRAFRQAAGIVSSGGPEEPIRPEERRYFGIGQGNLRATPLQVANSMASLARGGAYKLPRLFVDDSDVSKFEAAALGVSPKTLEVVYDGMRAVVDEPGGTAYKEFAYSGFAGQGVKVYGKTGSTEAPDNAWFAGFAKDTSGRSISIAVLVEGGQHGSADAAPLARDVIGFCIEAGYIGQ